MAETGGPAGLGGIDVEGFRGLRGEVRLGPGLNIIVGPNASGKTALLEAALTAATLNLEDMQIAMSLFMLPHAARGSEMHSLASTAAAGKARACIETYSGRRFCVNISKTHEMESRGLGLVSVVDLAFKPDGRKCRIRIRLAPEGLRLQVEGQDCSSRISGEPSVAMLTAGIMPSTMFDTLLGKLKRSKPLIFEKLAIRIGSGSYRVELAADDWDRLAAYIVEEDRSISFYSAGRGLQRAFQMLTLLELYDVVLIDEVENSMHPELLEEVASRLAEYSRRRQIVVTTQSLEAARILAAKVAGIPRPRMLEPVACSTEMEEELEQLLNLLVLNRSGNRIASALLRGCSALSHILSTPDVRLSYTLVGSQ